MKSNKAYNELKRELEDCQSMCKALERTLDKYENEKIQNKHHADILCQGCKNLIRHGGIFSDVGFSCALDRTCKDFKEDTRNKNKA